MRKSLPLILLPLLTLLLGVAGCDDGYSDAVVYEPRTDPIKVKNLGHQPDDPDRPGQLPLLKIADLDNENNPFYALNKKENFVDNDVFIDPTLASEKARRQIETELVSLFGSPANPKVGPMSKENRNLLQLSEGPDGVLVKGSKLYRLHCLHCHGVSGDGRGPTARWVNPHPRDYRHGHFKFQSVDQTAGQKPPHRDDLLRILEVGIEGTAMPAFNLLPTDQREALVSYVIHLSLRGQTELETYKGSFKYDKSKKVLYFADEGKTIATAIRSWYDASVMQWVASQSPEKQIKVGAYPFDPNNEADFRESVKRGRQIFENPPKNLNLGTDACMTCHIEYGRRSKFREDEFGTFAKPNNLLLGVYRGGRRPIDIYYRIHSGIGPSGMIAFGKSLPPNAIWDLVNFVQVLGNPAMRKSMGILVD